MAAFSEVCEIYAPQIGGFLEIEDEQVANGMCSRKAEASQLFGTD
jgi:hypothetical protein